MQYLLDIKKTQLEMMIDRGFPIGDEESILNMTAPEFTEYLVKLRGDTRRSMRSLLSRFYVDETGPRRTVLIYYADKTVGKHKTYVRNTENKRGKTRIGVNTNKNLVKLDEIRIQQKKRNSSYRCCRTICRINKSICS